MDDTAIWQFDLDWFSEKGNNWAVLDRAVN